MQRISKPIYRTVDEIQTRIKKLDALLQVLEHTVGCQAGARECARLSSRGGAERLYGQPASKTVH